MSFIETPRFPDYVAYDAEGGPEFQTDIVALASGFEQRNVNWSQARARYRIAMPLTGTRKEEILAWFRAMKGRGHGFRLKDWADYQAARVAGGSNGGGAGRMAEIINNVAASAASDNGTGMPTYQLVNKYTKGSLSDYRLIRKPVSGAVTIYRGGVAATAGASPGNYSLDTTTGIVSWVADQSSSVTAVGIGASTTITLSGTIGLAIGGRLYLTGLGGTCGTVLNGLAHAITNIVGNVHTISTATTGLAYTSGGTGVRYPQNTEALDWAGDFDVPVRFDVDYGSLRKGAPDFFSADSLSLVEIRV